MSTAKAVDCSLTDMDGVLVHEASPIPGDFIATLKESGPACHQEDLQQQSGLNCWSLGAERLCRTSDRPATPSSQPHPPRERHRMSPSFVNRRRTAGLLTAVAVAAGPVLLATPALASSSHHGAAKTCTITETERAAAQDELVALRGRLTGHKPTVAEKKALRSAVHELARAARHAKLTAEQRSAVKAERDALVAKLDTATTAEERTAIRQELRALRVELKKARLTGAQRHALAREGHELRVALRAKPQKADKKALRAELRTVKATLACTTV